MLYVPGTRQDRFAKAMNAGADAVVLDLEDSVEASQKGKARTLIADFLATPPSRALRLVRFNATDTPDGRQDAEFFARVEGFDGVLVPKVERAGDLEQVAQAFRQRASGIPPLLPLLETPRAILGAAAIAAAGAPVAALLLGAEDLTARLGVERTIDGEELLFARGQVAMAAAAIGAEAIDAIVTGFSDLEPLRRDCVRARGLGFSGKMAIHPAQVPVINEVFGPSASEIERARRIVEAFEAAQSAGEAVTKMDGGMIERPIVDRARRTLALAERLGHR
jgi:citrate lyase subunit beta/citryl-CoA lyase